MSIERMSRRGFLSGLLGGAAAAVVAPAVLAEPEPDWRVETTTDLPDGPITHAEDRIDGLDSFLEFLEKNEPSSPGLHALMQKHTYTLGRILNTA